MTLSNHPSSALSSIFSPHREKRFLAIFLIGIVLSCLFSYLFLDKPLVWWLVAHHSRNILILKVFANQIPNIVGTGVILFYAYFLIHFAKAKQNVTCRKLLYIANTVAVTIFLKEIFKGLCGRYWADTFFCQNPSLIVNNAYGFNWLQNIPSSSFPSGHTALIFAFSASAWWLFPALRWIWAGLAALVVIGQLGMYYHFLSDVIAGAGLGCLVAVYHYKYIFS